MSLKNIVTLLVVKAVSLAVGAVFSVLLLITRFRKGSEYFTIKPRPEPPKILNDPKYGTHRFVNLPKQGIRLHYVEKGNKDNPLLFCMHGFPECWFSFKSVLETFSDKYWVVAVDMRGYGDSDKPSSVKSYNTDLLVEDMREFLQVLGKDKCILMAHDWGAALAWWLVTKYPNMFRKHINMNGAHLCAFQDRLYSSWSQRRKSWYLFFFQNWYLPELMLSSNDLNMFNNFFQKGIKGPTPLTDEEVEVYKYYFSQEGALSPPINYYRNIDFDAVDELRQGRCKVDSLIVWGADDTALDREIADYTNKYCDKLQIEYIANCSHFILHDRPEEVHKAVRKFLNC